MAKAHSLEIRNAHALFDISLPGAECGHRVTVNDFDSISQIFAYLNLAPAILPFINNGLLQIRGVRTASLAPVFSTASSANRLDTVTSNLSFTAFITGESNFASFPLTILYAVATDVSSHLSRISQLFIHVGRVDRQDPDTPYPQASLTRLLSRFFMNQIWGNFSGIHE